MKISFKVGDKVRLSPAGLKSWTKFYCPPGRIEKYKNRIYQITEIKEIDPASYLYERGIRAKYSRKVISCSAADDVLGKINWSFDHEIFENFELVDSTRPIHRHPLTSMFV